MNYREMANDALLTEATNTLKTVRHLRHRYDTTRGNSYAAHAQRTAIARQQRKAQNEYGDICDELQRRDLADFFDALMMAGKA